MSTPRRGRRVAIGIVALAGLVAGAVAVRTHLGSAAPPAPEVHRFAAQRHAALVDLRNRLVPSAAGGWVAASPADDPSLEVWLLAGGVQAAPSAGFDRALDAAEEALAAGPGPATVSLSLVLAQVLPGPTADREQADRLAGDVLERAIAGLAAGEPSWLGPLLQLSSGTSSAAKAAGRHLVGLAGSVSCARLPAPDALPPPAGALTVAVRALVVLGRRCPSAPELLDAALGDPAWASWIALAELRDLALLVDGLSTRTEGRLADRLATQPRVRHDEPIDPGTAVAVMAVRRALGIDGDLPPALAHHLAGQVAHRGALPGRSASAPTPFDVAVVRQLVAEGLSAEATLRSTRRASTWAEETGTPDPVVGAVLAGRGRPSCRAVPDPSAQPAARVTFPGIVADQIWTVTRARCAGPLRVASLVRAVRADPLGGDAALPLAATLLAACRVDRASVGDDLAVRLRATGPFATDALSVWARAVVADPVASCAAVGDG